MVEVRVRAVGIDVGTQGPVVLLQETTGDRRLLAVAVGEPEAIAVASALEGVVGERPDTHRLIGAVLAAFGRRLVRVRVCALREHVFHAELELDDGTRVDARTSDAVVLALHAACRIDVEEAVLAEAGVAADTVSVEGSGVAGAGPEAGGTGAGEPESREMEEFRRFLDTASPEDFEPGDERPDDQ
ncbi:bifunctional nuclease family protein [Pseudonocardia sp. C8]|uniref:bifunctional nuclease family protein n=1 Tax=Pseudonocardia sp. C8 TaxID=2762759 RepID=UPI0016432470|nr:bifunctional nuclease family protein [Pseudonocardia sp. C8]MBC3192313.1 bifunctional nuclease family protein [Pseudonocardia sp. C8]